MTTPTITLAPGDLFTVAEYPYTRFEFGTDRSYRARYNEPMPADPGIPWAFSHAAILSSTPQPKPVIAAHLAFGALITTADYGTYRLERDHNRNVKFVPVELANPSGEACEDIWPTAYEERRNGI